MNENIPKDRPSNVRALDVDLEQVGEKYVGVNRLTGETYEASEADDVIRYLSRKR